MGQCLSGSKSEKMKELFLKFKQLKSIDVGELDPARAPPIEGAVMVTGIVAAEPGGQTLQSPVTGKTCVYYKLIVEKKETRARPKHKGRRGVKDNTKVEDLKQEYTVWVHQSTKEEKVNFRLVAGDRNSQNFLDIPLSKVPLVAHAIRDVEGFVAESDSGQRRTEMSFHVGEPVSLICQLSAGPDGLLRVGAVSHDTLDNDAVQWTNADKATWDEAIREPCFLVSDSPQVHAHRDVVKA